MSYQKMIEELAEQLGPVVGHRFDMIDVINPGGLRIPAEGLAEDHTMGIYCERMPRKMLEASGSFTEIRLAELYPQRGGEGVAYLEYAPLRGVEFQAEKLQYLKEGFLARVAECKYKAGQVLGTLYVMNKVYGDYHIYVNTRLPMPLWIRPNEMGDRELLPQVAIQAFSGDRCTPTNIHVDVPKECAALYYEACRNYYEVIGD